jgi:hypothetical protein
MEQKELCSPSFGPFNEKIKIRIFLPVVPLTFPSRNEYILINFNPEEP